jgi:cell division protein FtsB
MARRHFPTPTDDAFDETDPTPSAGAPAVASGEPDLATLAIAGITRRRMAVFVGVLLAAWIVIVFARQVSDASAATSKAEAMIATNDAKQHEIDALEGELQRIQERPFVLQQARGYGLGGPHEISFTLAPGAPALPANAPGSAASRLGAPTSVSPLERWLTLLFGPGG